MKAEFSEEQRFKQWWLWLILIPLGILSIYGMFKQLILGEPFGDKPFSDLGLVLFALFLFSFIGLNLTIKLRTKIDNNRIQMSFFPFTKKKINWNEIKDVEVLNYGFVGGWGIRLWTKYGTVYNIKGNKGLAIELKNGKKLLIGTQKETELKNILKKIKPQINL